MFRLMDRILGKVTVRIRESRGQTQREYAELAGISWEMLMRIESGKIISRRHQKIISIMDETRIGIY